MNKNKKLIKIIALVCFVTVVLAGSITGIVVAAKDTQTEKLVIYNWADYIDPTVLDDFVDYYKEVTGKDIEVVYSMFDTNETMMTELMKGDSQIDLVCPSEYSIEKLMKQDLLYKLDFSALDSTGYEYENYLDNVYGVIRDKVADIFKGIKVGNLENEQMNDYFVPYMWGTLGILYNAEKVSAEEIEEQGWGILWNTGNNETLNGKILVKDSVRDIYAATVIYLKESGQLPESYDDWSIEKLINTVDDTLLDACAEVLASQREIIKGYEVDFGKDDMLNEVAYVDLAWSGDALWAIEESYDEETDSYKLDYHCPTYGSNVWFDGWAIPKSAANTEAAMLFINYMCRPDIAMRNSMEIGYTCGIDPEVFLDDTNPDSVEAIAYLEECEYDVDEFFGDTRRYPYSIERQNFLNDDQVTYKVEELNYLKDNGFDADAMEGFFEELNSATMYVSADYFKDVDEEGELLDTYSIAGLNVLADGSYNIDTFLDNMLEYAAFSDRLGVMQDFGDKNDSVVSMWEGVKGGDAFPWQLLVTIIGIVGGIALICGGIILYRNLKGRRRLLKVLE